VTRWRIGDRVDVPFVGDAGIAGVPCRASARSATPVSSPLLPIGDHLRNNGVGFPRAQISNLVALPRQSNFANGGEPWLPGFVHRFARGGPGPSVGRANGSRCMAAAGSGCRRIMIGSCRRASCAGGYFHRRRWNWARFVGVAAVINAREGAMCAGSVREIHQGGHMCARCALGAVSNLREFDQFVAQAWASHQVGPMAGNTVPAVRWGG